MRIARYDGGHVGLVEGDALRDVTSVCDQLPPLHWPVPPGDQFIAHLPQLGPALVAAAADAPRIPLDRITLLSPVANPAHVIGAPVNYRAHAEEARDAALNYGVHMPDHEGFATPIDKFGLFLKSQTGLIGPGEGVTLVHPDRRNDHEVELAVVIGKGGRDIGRDQAMDHVAGYAIGLDLTVRGTEDRSFRKSPDGYSVLGPWLVTPDEIGDPGALDLSISVDGELRQKSNTRMLIVDIADLIARASHMYALYPGDVIMTGTPEGVGPIKAGCTMRAEIEGIGAMEVKVN